MRSTTSFPLLFHPLLTPPHDILAVFGDFNAVFGPATDNNGVVGPFGSGDSNNNSDRLLSLCAIQGLAILGF